MTRKPRVLQSVGLELDSTERLKATKMSQPTLLARLGQNLS